VLLWTCVMQVQRKFWSDSVHVTPLETAGIITVEMISYCGTSARGHEWLATCVPVQDVPSQGILSSSTTCEDMFRRKPCMFVLPIGGNF